MDNNQNDRDQTPVPNNVHYAEPYQTEPKMSGEYVAPIVSDPYTPPAAQTKSTPYEGEAVASVILGLVSILLAWVAPISLICSILGLILSRQARKAGNTTGAARAGRGLSWVGLVLAILLILLVILLLIIFIIRFANGEFSSEIIEDDPDALEHIFDILDLLD